MGFEPWSKQIELLQACNDHRFITCRSGHKCGKSEALAALGLWWIVTKPRSRVVVTAPSEPQVENVIWAAVKRLYNQAAKRGWPLGGILNQTAYAGLTFSDGRDFFGRTTSKPENFAGISAPNLLILVDEASGIDEPIFEAIFGNAAGNATVVMISNPTKITGTFFDSFHSKRNSWKTIGISSLENPNFHGGSVPGLATPEFVEWAKGQWGYPSAYFDVRVLGEFPSQSEDSVISRALIQDAVMRGRLIQPDYTRPLSIGLDVARFGDDESVITAVRGNQMFRQKVLRNADGPAVGNATWAFAREHARFDEVPEINVDVIGVGASAFDTLATKEFIRAVPVNVSERSREPDKYPNLRSQLWFGMREWLKAGGALPDDERLIEELAAPSYAVDTKGRQSVDSKDRIKDTLRRSPDRADSACLAVYRSRFSGNSFKNIDQLRALLPQRRM